MTIEETTTKLKEMGNPKYAGTNRKMGIETEPTLGIGITDLKKFAKQIKKNHDLSLKLWDTPIFEAKLLSVFIEDPKKVSEEQIDSQIPNSRGFMLADYYSEFVLAKSGQLDSKIEEWTQSKIDHIKKCGYSALYIKAKTDKKTDDKYFEKFLDNIEKELHSSENWVKESMNYCLCYIGERSNALREKCLAIAKRIGRVEVDYGETSCVTVDVTNWLNSSRVKKKLVI